MNTNNIMKFLSMITPRLSVLKISVYFVFIIPCCAADIYKWTDDNGRIQLSDLPPLRSKTKNLIITNKYNKLKIPKKSGTTIKTNRKQNRQAKNCLIIQNNLKSLRGKKLVLNKNKKIVKLTKAEYQKLISKLEKQIKDFC